MGKINVFEQFCSYGKNIFCLCEKCTEDFLPIHYLLKGEIAHIVTGLLNIYSVVHSSLGIILQTVQPYHYYSACHITDRDHDLRRNCSIYFCIWIILNINKHLKVVV